VATAVGEQAEAAGAPMEVGAMAAEVVREAWAEVWAVPGGRAATEAVAMEAAAMEAHMEEVAMEAEAAEAKEADAVGAMEAGATER